MVQLKLIGEIGSNLFQYAFARIIAEHHGYAFEAKLPQNKSATHLRELLSVFADAPLKIDGKRFHQPVERYLWGQDGFDGYRLDLNQILCDTSERRIELKGVFERYEYFKCFKEKIRSWFDLVPMERGYRITPQDLVVHVRRTDFITWGRALDLSYYDQVLNSMSWRRLFIVGDDFDLAVKIHFRKYKPIYVHGDPVQDFRFIKAFNQIVGTQSTFCWWAAFLSEASTIKLPIADRTTPFSRTFPHIDLVVDEPRYEFVEDVPCRVSPFQLCYAKIMQDLGSARFRGNRRRVFSVSRRNKG